MITIPLPAHYHETARRASDMIQAGFRGRNYTGLADPDAYVTGYLGEFAVRDWFRAERVEHTYNVNIDGRSQRSEFILHTGRDWRLEVKTASLPTHKLLAMPEAQQLDFDVVVAVRLAAESAAEIHGWLTQKEARAMDVRDLRIRTRVQPLDELRPPARLIETLRRMKAKHDGQPDEPDRHADWWREYDARDAELTQAGRP